MQLITLIVIPVQIEKFPSTQIELINTIILSAPRVWDTDIYKAVRLIIETLTSDCTVKDHKDVMSLPLSLGVTLSL